MQQYNYGQIAKFLHWSIALLVIINYIIGLTLDSTSWYAFHKQTGMTILLLMIIRFIWRMISRYPQELPELSSLDKIGAVTFQVLFYILLFAVPIGGVLLVQAHGYSLKFWNFIQLPAFISQQPNEISHSIKEAHEWGAHAIIILAALHATAALWHHFINRNRVLLRMLPFTKNSRI